MNVHDLRTAQANFEGMIPGIQEERQELYRIRDAFRRYYTLDRIRNMPLEHYALGMEFPESGEPLFCHTLEYELDGLGKTKGATSFKFGIYRGIVRSDTEFKWRVTKKFGSVDDHLAAYRNVRQAIYELVIAGQTKDLDAIIASPISPMFKGKILCTFYPNDYLNVFSNTHLNYFLTQLGLDSDEMRGADEVLKREELVRFKNEDPVMKNWNMDDYMVFLYRCYPGRPPKERGQTNDDVLDDYRDPVFPEFPNPEWIDLSIAPPGTPNGAKQGSGKPKGGSNPDYEKEARKRKKLGDRGEKIVLDMERERLRKAGRPDLAKRVKKAKRDYEGFDIKSFETDESPRHIEVKATRARVGRANFFLSANEYEKSKTLENYYVYMVFDIMSSSPKIWPIANPFHPEDNRVKMTEMSYRVEINTSSLS